MRRHRRAGDRRAGAGARTSQPAVRKRGRRDRRGLPGDGGDAAAAERGGAAQLLLRLALDMRPDFTAARLLLADMQRQRRPGARHSTRWRRCRRRSAGRRRAAAPGRVLDELGQTDEAARLLERWPASTRTGRSRWPLAATAAPAGPVRRGGRLLRPRDRPRGHAEPRRLAAVLRARHRLRARRATGPRRRRTSSSRCSCRRTSPAC